MGEEEEDDLSYDCEALPYIELIHGTIKKSGTFAQSLDYFMYGLYLFVLVSGVESFLLQFQYRHGLLQLQCRHCLLQLQVQVQGQVQDPSCVGSAKFGLARLSINQA